MITSEAEARLDGAIVIAAFEGWNDAGEAATDAVAHLLTAWRARHLGTVEPDDYYDFQVNRPLVGLDSEGNREVSWRSTSCWHCTGNVGGRPIVLVTGIEPNLRWKSFCTELIEYLTGLGVSTFVTLGALLADVPHTRPVPITGNSTDSGLTAKFGLQPSTYTGPTGIVGVLQDEAYRRGLATISYWAAVPHYVAQPPAPKATMALLGALEDLTGVPIDLTTMAEEAKAWERGVDELASDDSDVADYVRSLEEERDTADLPEASGDAIAREFERYLKRRTDDG